MNELQVADKILNKIMHQTGTLNNWAFIPAGTKTVSGIECEMGRICLANLMYNPMPFNVKYFIFNPKIGKNDSKPVRRYVKWLANKSPLAPAFHSKDVDDIVDRGAIFLTDFPPQFVVTAAMTLRYVVEFPHIIKFWNIFQKHTPPEAAFVMAHNFYAYSDKIWAAGNYGNTNHQWVQNHNFGRKELKKFIEFSPVHMGGNTMETTQDYRNLTKIWGFKDGRTDPLQTPPGKMIDSASQWDTTHQAKSFPAKNVQKLCKKWLELNYASKNK